MKTIKSIVMLALLGAIVSPSYADVTSGLVTAPQSDSDAVVAAIKQTDIHIQGYFTSLYDNLTTGQQGSQLTIKDLLLSVLYNFNAASGAIQPTIQSVLMSVFNTPTPSIQSINPGNATAQTEPVVDVLASTQAVNDLIYQTGTAYSSKFSDVLQLLQQPVETSSNDNVQSSFSGGGSDFGSFQSIIASGGLNIPVSSGNTITTMLKPLTTNALSSDSLFGTTMFDQPADSSHPVSNAMYYINQIQTALPPPTHIDFTLQSSNGGYQLMLPITDSNPPAGATTYSGGSISTPLANYVPLTGNSDNSSKGANAFVQQHIKPYFEKRALYRDYLMQYRGMMALRSLYLNIMYKSFAYRLPTSSDSNGNQVSLAQIEEKMGTSGLSQDYYNKLSDPTQSTPADRELEMLKAIQELKYFVYQVHKDTEALGFMQATGALYAQNASYMLFNSKYVDKLVAAAMAGCWQYDGDVTNPAMSPPNGVMPAACTAIDPVPAGSTKFPGT